jgi:hypothetical protein
VRRVRDKAGAPIIVGKADMSWGQIHEGNWDYERPNHYQRDDGQNGIVFVLVSRLFHARPSTIAISSSVNPDKS